VQQLKIRLFATVGIETSLNNTIDFKTNLLGALKGLSKKAGYKQTNR
jgi:hypothetical protein